MRGGPGLAEPALSSGIAGPTCWKCGGKQACILRGKYGDYFKCAARQGDTAIKLTCKQSHGLGLGKSLQACNRDCVARYCSQVCLVNKQLDRT